jgi:hypothetical protein
VVAVSSQEGVAVQVLISRAHQVLDQRSST